MYVWDSLLADKRKLSSPIYQVDDDVLWFLWKNAYLKSEETAGGRTSERSMLLEVFLDLKSALFSWNT